VGFAAIWRGAITAHGRKILQKQECPPVPLEAAAKIAIRRFPVWQLDEDIAPCAAVEGP
jgi:hypothetical protein